MADSGPEFPVGSRGGLSDQGLELRETHLNWVEVGAVGQKEQEPRADTVQNFDGGWGLVAGEIVEE